MSHDLFLISSTMLVFSCLFGSLMLWIFGGKSQAKRVMFVAGTGAALFNMYAAFKSYFSPSYSLEILDFWYSIYCIFLLYTIYIYFRILMQPALKNKNIIWQWIIFSGIYILVYEILYLTGHRVSLHSLTDIANHIGQAMVWVRLAAFVHFIVLFLILIILIGKMYQQHKKEIADKFSYSEKISLSWIPYLLALFLLVGAITFFDVPISFDNFDLNNFANFGYGIFFFVVGFLGSQQQDIFSDEIIPNQENKQNIKTGNMPANIHAALKKQLIILMEEQRLFLNPDLRLDYVAKELNTNRTYVSQIIKEDFNENFIGFVNCYRIAEAKLLLTQTNHKLSIDEISERVGFKSISSFNLFFKRYVGQTPATFKKSISEISTNHC